MKRPKRYFKLRHAYIFNRLLECKSFKQKIFLESWPEFLIITLQCCVIELQMGEGKKVCFEQNFSIHTHKYGIIVIATINTNGKRMNETNIPSQDLQHEESLGLYGRKARNSCRSESFLDESDSQEKPRFQQDPSSPRHKRCQ